MKNHIKRMLVRDWWTELILTPGSSCEKCDFYPKEGRTCPKESCRFYDFESDRMIGGYLKKLHTEPLTLEEIGEIHQKEINGDIDEN